MAAFLLLPEELIRCIVSCLVQAGKYAVCQLNKDLNRIAIPLLYRHVDLRILSDNKLPRLDRFCLNIIGDISLASRVESLRIGPSTSGNFKDIDSCLPHDTLFDDNAMVAKAMNIMVSESLASSGILREDFGLRGLKYAIIQRNYVAYTTLILSVLPSLRELDLADHHYSASVNHHHIVDILDFARRLPRDPPWQQILNRISSIKKVTYNFDRTSGVHYFDHQRRAEFDKVLVLPGIRTFEFSIEPMQAVLARPGLARNLRASTITVLIVRHSTPVLDCIMRLLACTPQLESLTYDMFWNKHEREEALNRWIDLEEWGAALHEVKDTLTTLSLAVEYCDTSAYSFHQPRIGKKLYGRLNLSDFHQLTSLEVPVPFLTGDIGFSITADISAFPPPRLQNLSLRLDMSDAQFSYPVDTSILAKDLSRIEATVEAQFAVNARMDMSYMSYATLKLLDCAPKLRTITVWQPADSTLRWFPSQVEDFATACKKKSLAGFLLFPTLLQSRIPDQQYLVREYTVFNPSNPGFVNGEHLFREERAGIPLGLATQYHIHELQSRRVRKCDSSTLTTGSRTNPVHKIC